MMSLRGKEKQAPRRRKGSIRSACLVAGCNEPVYGRDLCRRHYSVMLSGGSPAGKRAKGKAGTKKIPGERKPKIAKPKSMCAVYECLNTSYCRGLCRRHYNALLNGRYDVTGKKLREKYEEPPFNRAVRRTALTIATAEATLSDMKRAIKEGNKALKERVNKRLIDINEMTAAGAVQIRDSEFVFGNIHRLRPGTLVLLMGDDSKKKVRRLAEKDKVRIAWNLVRGVQSSRILEMMPWYTEGQVQNVVDEVRNGKLPVPKHLRAAKPKGKTDDQSR